MKYLPFLLLLGGCMPRREIKTFAFPDLTINVADQKTVTEQCIVPGWHWDNGTIIKKGQSAGGCWDNKANTMWVVNSCRGIAAIIHEICHFEGYANNVCDLIHVDANKICRGT